MNILDLWDLLRKRWKRVAITTVLGTGVAVAYALLATPMFQAHATVAPPSEDQPNAAAALGALGGFGSQIATSFGFSLGGSDANRLAAILTSHRLLARVVDKHHLMPILFEDDWDAQHDRWRVDDPDDAPNIWDADKLFEEILTVKNDIDAGILRISLEFRDPAEATRILGFFLEELAFQLQEDELEKIDANRRFAEENLREATDPMIVAKLQALLSDQIEKAMMTQNVENFAYEMLDPPAASDEKVKPKRSLIGAMGLTASLCFGIFLAFLAEWLQNARNERATRA